MSLTRRDWSILALATGFVVAAFLVVSRLTYAIGFPLDDSWIHLTYARNLAVLHEWSFLPGQPSAGSTSPLWTFLLSIGFFLQLGPYFWTYLLGGLLLFLGAAATEVVLRHALTGYAPSYPWAGLFFIFEWHMTWVAVSGMETGLHILIVIVTLGLLMSGSRRYWLFGVLAGLSIWVRPDGLTLMGPLFLYVLFKESSAVARIQAALKLAAGLLGLLLPYLLFNLWLSGTPMPNTFYAKQAEYQDTSVISHFLVFPIQFFAGPSFVLIPGFLRKVIGSIRQREWGVLLSAIWTIGYIILYVLRLPVYQHGRYLLPALGMFLLIGLMGFIELLPSVRTYRMRLIRHVWLLSLGLFSLAFTGFGAYTYGNDVAFIESEMVTAAKWAASNIPPDALIAAHDIGALGFYGHHRIVDLAGLITPDVVPFIRDEAKLAVFMDEQGVNYLITTPEWYPSLIKRGNLIFRTDGRFVPKPVLQNMAIYQWEKP